MIASWDAEEVGLVGSTEFTELYREELISRAVVHINQDCPVKGNATFVPRADEFLAEALFASALATPMPCDPRATFFDSWSNLQNPEINDDIGHAYCLSLRSCFSKSMLYIYKKTSTKGDF